MSILEELAENLLRGQAEKVQELVQEALNHGFSPQQVLNQGLVAGMDVVGQKFKENEIFLPEVLFAAQAMKAGMKILGPLLAEGKVEAVGRVVIGTVEGDLHDIGKNIVGMMLEGAGFQVVDLGADVAPEKFVEAVRRHQPHILAMSAMLTTTMPAMGRTIQALREAGLRDRLEVMVGGVSVTQGYAEEIGADGYAPNAASAVDKARELLGIK